MGENQDFEWTKEEIYKHCQENSVNVPKNVPKNFPEDPSGNFLQDIEEDAYHRIFFSSLENTLSNMDESPEKQNMRKRCHLNIIRVKNERLTREDVYFPTGPSIFTSLLLHMLRW